MFLVRRPSPAAIARFLSESQHHSLTYAPIGLVNAADPSFDRDETVVTIGRGRPDFERARLALAGWAQFRVGWAELFPMRAPIAVGTDVGVLIHHIGVWSLNGARVVYTTGDAKTGNRFGYAYGTLPSHAEAGEELFEVALDAMSGDVTYRIRAASRPRATLAKAGYPIVRMLQARFRRDSVEAMKRAAGA